MKIIDARRTAFLLVVGLLALPAVPSSVLSAAGTTAAATSAAAQEPASPLPTFERAERWAIVDVTAIPMDAEEALPGTTVLIEDGRIVAMGPNAEVQVPDDARRIEGSGRYLLPGLAEMHAHVPPGQNPERAYVEEVLFLYLANGITTIRGMLGAPYQIDLRGELQRGEATGPHFLVGAPSINGNTAPTPAEAEARVREHATAGYDFLKIHPGVPRDSWDRMVEVADEVGITFAGHVPADVGIHHAIATGMSTIDHLDGYVEVTRREGVSAEADGPAAYYRATDPEALGTLVDELAEAGVWLVPTQYLWNHLNGMVDADSILALPEFRYIPEDLRASYRRTAEQRANSPSITPASTRAHAEMRQEFLAATHRGGARILMGTDSPQLFNVPGFALHRELPLMEAAGMTPFEVLVTGTWNVATYVGESLDGEDDFGTLAVGNRADLLLLDDNPLESLDVLRTPVGVMVAGRWLSGEAIRAGLEAIAARYD